jgi:hypothetical protein
MVAVFDIMEGAIGAGVVFARDTAVIVNELQAEPLVGEAIGASRSCAFGGHPQNLTQRSAEVTMQPTTPIIGAKLHYEVDIDQTLIFILTIKVT